MSSKIIPSPFYHFQQYTLERFTEHFIRENPEKVTNIYTAFDQDIYYRLKHETVHNEGYNHVIFSGDLETNEDIKKCARAHIEVARNISSIESPDGPVHIDLYGPDAEESYNYSTLKVIKLNRLDIPVNLTKDHRKYLEENLTAFLSNATTFPERLEKTFNSVLKKYKKDPKNAL